MDAWSNRIARAAVCGLVALSVLAPSTVAQAVDMPPIVLNNGVIQAVRCL